MSSSIYFILILALVSQVLGAVVNLTDDDFDKFVDGSTNVLVEFYAPWCGHCKNLAPEWKVAGETFQSDDDIIIAAVDATAHPNVAKRVGVKGYPTIKFYAKGSTSPQDYDGGRTADTIVSWVNKKIGTDRKLKKAPSNVVDLTVSNFDAIALGEKAALVEFYAPWCGHCKQLTPKYEQLANIFAGEKNVVIAKVDATEEGDLAGRYDVGGYPTLKFFPAGSSEPIDFQEAREVETMVNFVNTHAGTARSADGNLLPTAGRLAELDELIAAAEKIDEAFVASLKEVASKLAGAAADYGKIYASTAGKVAAKGAEFVTKEVTRLGNMAKSPSVNPESKTNFQLRQNILQAFAKDA